MDRPKILVTHRLFEEPRAKLAEHLEVEFWSDSDRPPRAEVLRRVADKDGLICLLTEKIDDELLAAAPRLRSVANIAVGYDNIDLILAGCTGIVRAKDHFQISERALDRLFTYADAHRFWLPVQFHSHQFGTAMSRTDARHGLCVEGFVSAIVPRTVAIGSYLP